VLDEPTNDLDSETLELLEERLSAFAGTVLLVSHDRAFLNQVVTSTIVFENGNVREYVGGYDDWQRQAASQRTAAATKRARDSYGKSVAAAAKVSGPVPSDAAQPSAALAGANGASGASSSTVVSSGKSRRLKFKEQQELAALPATIERLETTVQQLHEQMARPEFYKQAGDQIAQVQSQLADLEQQLSAAYVRWEQLEQLAT